MKRTGEHTFDAPVAQVWAMMRDPDAHLAKAERAGHRDLEMVEQEVTDERARFVIGRTVTIELPGFAKRILEPTNRVRTIDVWEDRGDGTYGGTFDTEVKAPATFTGVTHIEEAGEDRTFYRVEITVEVKVPFIGKKLEPWAKDAIEEQLANEFAAGDEWLAAHA